MLDPRRPPTGMRLSRGFTMVELAVVIVIIGVLAAAAIPAMAGLSSTKARVAARQLSRDINFARERAITTGTVVWVSFDLPGNSYTILQEHLDSPGRGGAAMLTDPATGRDFTQSLSSGEFAGVTITGVSIGDGYEVGFDWRGRPRDSALAALSSAGSISLSEGNTVTIQPETGFTSVQP